MKLYSYWRSSSAYRVRIALNLKELDYEIVPVSLLPGVSEQRGEEYRAINPQMLVPFFDDGNVAIGQSMAILEYLEETYPDRKLLPEDEPLRSMVRAFCNIVACDIQPLGNLRVTEFLKSEYGVDPQDGWYATWMQRGFEAAEAMAADDGPYVLGERVTLADALLVPQVYNARRFQVPLDAFPKLVAATDACNELPAFVKAAPEQQPDAA